MFFLTGWWCIRTLSLLGGSLGFQNNLLPRAGHINRDSLATQVPGQCVCHSHITFMRVGWEIHCFRKAVIHEGLQSPLHADVFLGGDILRDHEHLANSLRDCLQILARTVLQDLFDDCLAGFLVQTTFGQGLLEERAGIRQLQIVAVIVDVADICQGEDRFAAITFTACDGGNRPGRRDRGLGSVADSILSDPG